MDEYLFEYLFPDLPKSGDVSFSDEKINEIIKNFNVKTQESYVTGKGNKYVVKIDSFMNEFLVVTYDKLALNHNTTIYYKNGEFFINFNKCCLEGDNFCFKYDISSDVKKSIISVIRRLDTKYDISYQWEDSHIVVYGNKN